MSDRKDEGYATTSWGCCGNPTRYGHKEGCVKGSDTKEQDEFEGLLIQYGAWTRKAGQEPDANETHWRDELRRLYTEALRENAAALRVANDRAEQIERLESENADLRRQLAEAREPNQKGCECRLCNAMTPSGKEDGGSNPTEPPKCECGHPKGFHHRGGQCTGNASGVVGCLPCDCLEHRPSVPASAPTKYDPEDEPRHHPFAKDQDGVRCNKCQRWHSGFNDSDERTDFCEDCAASAPTGEAEPSDEIASKLAPERIWLQHGGHVCTSQWTWCEDKIEPDDIEYVRPATTGTPQSLQQKEGKP